MPIITPPTPSPVRVSITSRRFENSNPVLGYDDNPAANRRIVALGLSVQGVYEVKAEARTDGNGDYTITVAGAGPADRYIIIAVGDPDHQEHTRALGNITGAL